MRKLLILVILLFSPLLLNSFEKSNNYLDDINNAYNEYEIYESYSTPNYSLIVVRGECNNKLTYGIFFYSETSKDYSLKLYGENTEYIIQSDNRGDIYSVAFKIPTDGVVLKIFKQDKEQTLPHPIILEDFKLDDLTNRMIGLNKGSNIDSLSKGSLSLIDIYMIICGGIISICVVVIIIYYFKRRGMFDKNIRSKGVFNIKEFLEKNIEEEYREEVPIKDIIDLDEDNYKDVSEPVVEKSVYNKVKDDNYYNDDSSGFPLHDYLKDKGYILNYDLIDDEEKNKIMLELIHLKDSHKITNDEYLLEVYKLWKK